MPVADLVKVDSRAARRRGSGERGPLRELLAFALGEDAYAVDLKSVREILAPPPVTLVPRAPHAVLGVCSVRGLLVTVIDLRMRLSLPPVEPTRKTRILLTAGRNQEIFGLVVDEVKQVIRLPESQIEIASNVLGGDLSEHVVGIGRPSADMPIILLDLGAIVANVKESI